MLTALALICSILATPDLRDCDETNARVVMLVPERFASPITCAIHGQAYIAGSAIAQNLAESDRIKIVCRRAKPPPIIISRHHKKLRGNRLARGPWRRGIDGADGDALHSARRSDVLSSHHRP